MFSSEAHRINKIKKPSHQFTKSNQANSHEHKIVGSNTHSEEWMENWKRENWWGRAPAPSSQRLESSLSKSAK